MAPNGSDAATTKAKILSLDQAKQTALNFINQYLLNTDYQATVKAIKLNGSLYDLKLSIASTKGGPAQETDSALSADGQLFYPQVINIAEFKTAQAAQDKAAAAIQAPAKVPTSAQPKVELFVMSYCPYGLQMEKGLLPVIKTLGDSLDFKLEFVDYSMHGQQEIKENLTQYCLRGQQPTKLVPYLDCFTTKGDSAACLEQTKVDQAKLQTCLTQTDQAYHLTGATQDPSSENGNYPAFNVDYLSNRQYDVQGSPTLVINGQKVVPQRDPASLLKVICQAFNQAPAACQTKLSTASPAVGFGSGLSATNDTSSCGH